MMLKRKLGLAALAVLASAALVTARQQGTITITNPPETYFKSAPVWFLDVGTWVQNELHKNFTITGVDKFFTVDTVTANFRYATAYNPNTNAATWTDTDFFRLSVNNNPLDSPTPYEYSMENINFDNNAGNPDATLRLVSPGKYRWITCRMTAASGATGGAKVWKYVGPRAAAAPAGVTMVGPAGGIIPSGNFTMHGTGAAGKTFRVTLYHYGDYGDLSKAIAGNGGTVALDGTWSLTVTNPDNPVVIGYTVEYQEDLEDGTGNVWTEDYGVPVC